MSSGQEGAQGFRTHGRVKEFVDEVAGEHKEDSMSKAHKDMAPEHEESAQNYGFEDGMRGRKFKKKHSRGSKRRGRRKGRR